MIKSPNGANQINFSQPLLIFYPGSKFPFLKAVCFLRALLKVKIKGSPLLASLSILFCCSFTKYSNYSSVSRIIRVFHQCAFCFGTNSILSVMSMPSANLFNKLIDGFLVPFSNLLMSA